MKCSSLLLVFLLLSHLLLDGAFGARIGKFSEKSANSNLTNVENEKAMENVVKNDDQSKVNNDLSEVNSNDVKHKDNEEDDGSSKGNYRKLITSTTVSTSTAKPIQENFEHGKKKMDTKWDDRDQTISSSSSIHRIPSTAYDLDKHKKVLPRTEYENAMDMTVMDYSPAKRKPPIHN